MSFEGKVILITGGSAGIGAACAEYFAKEGALLAIVGRNAEKFEKVVENIKASGVETEPLVIVADITVDANRIMSETIDKYGRLDVLINNAGFATAGSIEDMNLADFDSMMATNVRAVIELMQLAVPHLVESKGNVVNVSSISSLMVFEGFLGYCVSKAALDKITKVTAIGLSSKGVRVNGVNLGFVDTDFHFYFGLERGSPEYNEIMEGIGKKHPIGRLGNFEDCVDAIAYLANEKTSFVTGACLRVDGGLSTKSAF